METATQDDVKATWQSYWETHGPRDYSMPKLSSYQLAVFDILKRHIRKNRCSKILGAGCGLDYVAAHLQRAFGNSLDITLLDIAPKVLEMNEVLFRNNGLEVKTVEGSIFDMPFHDGSFDLVFNTGVMEHFTHEDQVSMVKEVMRTIKTGGFYITANPSDAGILYKHGMAAAKEKGIWPYGVEVPVSTLFQVAKKSLRVATIHEVERDFAGQVAFLVYVNEKYRGFAAILQRLARFRACRFLLDHLFGTLFGTYLIVSIMERRS